MQGPAHLAIGWVIGAAARLDARRDRRIVGLAALLPDIDVLVYPLAYLLSGANLDQAYALYAAVHHRYTHGIVCGCLCMLLAWWLATPQWRLRVTLLTALAFLTHLVGDVVASGPAWPVYPLWPFADVAWSVSWSVNASDWRNITLSVLALALTLAWSWRRGYSPLECLSYRVDDWLAAVLRGEFHATARFRLVLYTALVLVSAAVLLPLWFYLQ